MATQKSCTGTVNIVGWTNVSPLCIYQLTLTVDLVPIANTVAVNSGMTPAQIATLLNANRTGNTTGTISVQIVGINLQITITGIVLPDTAVGLFSYMISGTGFPCGDFPIQLPSPMTCLIIPTPRPKNNGGINNFGVRCPITVEVSVRQGTAVPPTVNYGVCGIYSNPVLVRGNIYRYTKNTTNLRPASAWIFPIK